MPSAIKYIPPTDAERSLFSTSVVSETTARVRDYEKAVSYYNGYQDRSYALSDPDEIDDQVFINLVKMTCDRTTAFVFPELPKIVVLPGDSERSPEEIWVDGLLTENGGLANLTKWVMRGFLAGHTYLRVKLPKKGKKYPQLQVLQPTAVTVYWAADDVDTVLWYEQRYSANSVMYVIDYVQEDDGTWVIYTYKGKGKPGIIQSNVTLNELVENLSAFETFTLESRTVHPSTIPPIIDVAHLPAPKGFYGVGEFDQKLLQDAINRMATQRNSIIRQFSDPVDIVTGVDADDINMDGDVITIANEKAQPHRVELKGDISPIDAAIDRSIVYYLSVARTVLLKGDVKDLQRVTNASVMTLFLDALSKNRVLRDVYGTALMNAVRLAMKISYGLNDFPVNPDTLELSIEWQSPLPVDATEIANVNAIGVAGGWMGKQTAAERLDLKWDEQEAQITADDEKTLQKQKAVMDLNPPIDKPEKGV